MRKLMIITTLLVATLLAPSLTASMVAAFPETVRERTFVTYLVDPAGTPNTDTYNMYAYSDTHWKTGTTDITYYINLSGAPAGAKNAVTAAFETWDKEVKANLFNDNIATITKVTGGKLDGKNVISWGRLGKGIIAQTTVWYYPSTGEIIEFGMVFNTAYKWGIDPDGEGGVTFTDKFDVQDIATHESGHTLMLDDLYDQESNRLTMYGYGSYGETYARTLGAGDVTGILAIYPPKTP